MFIMLEKGKVRIIDKKILLLQPESKVIKPKKRRLQKDGLVQTMPYRSIFLTKKGEELAKFCKNRHEIVYKFLLNIGVAPEVAHSDAEGLEHHVSIETLEAFKNYIK